MIKKIIRLLLPPILSKAWRQFNGRGPANITYKGVYNSFDEVIKDFPFTTKYNSQDSLTQAKQKASEIIK